MQFLCSVNSVCRELKSEKNRNWFRERQLQTVWTNSLFSFGHCANQFLFCWLRFRTNTVWLDLSLEDCILLRADLAFMSWKRLKSLRVNLRSLEDWILLRTEYRLGLPFLFVIVLIFMHCADTVRAYFYFCNQTFQLGISLPSLKKCAVLVYWVQ